MEDTKLPQCTPSDMFSLERVHYFARMLITPDDMTSEQEYFLNKLRRHNRLMHGWGVVCGCEVTPGTNAYEVKITRGYILGPYGDEIIIPKELTYVIGTDLVCGCTAEPTSGSFQIDPWCSDVKRTIKSGQTYYIAVKHKEIETRPVRAHPVGCSCEETRCEPSRIMDCFLVKALETLPASHDPNFAPPIFVPPITDPNLIISGRLESCVECLTEPWVVLADVTISENNMIEVCNIDNCCHRRWVISLADVWWKCQAKPAISSISPNQGEQGVSNLEVTINGCNFFKELETIPEVTFDPGEGIDVGPTTLDSHWKLVVMLNIEEDAPLVAHNVKVTNPDEQSATLIDGFHVLEAPIFFRRPIIDRILPPKIELGKAQKITIYGSNFVKGTSIDLGSGITVSEPTFISAKELTVTIEIDPAAKVGPRDITIVNPGVPEKKFKNMFTVVAPKKDLDPVIEGIEPPILRPGDEKVIIIKGKNFDEKVKVDFGAPTRSRISLKKIESITENEIRVSVKVWANAHSGSRDISVTNPGRAPVSKSELFRIEREG